MSAYEMSGALLDLWVALALGHRRSENYPNSDPISGNYWLRMGRGVDVFACPRFSFSSREAMAVIERFKPALDYRPAIGEWAASCRANDKLFRTGFGKTAAEAVCRAVVLARFGSNPQLDTEDEPTDYNERINGRNAS